MIINDKITAAPLVQGLFTPTDAKDVVNPIIDQKINFYRLQQVKDMVAEEGYGKGNFATEIEDLRKLKEELKDFIDLAKQTGHRLEIKAHIDIKLVK